MASLIVESKMWLILLLSICSASLKFVVAEDLEIGQVAQLKQLPSLAPPLSYYRPLTYPTGDLQEINFKGPRIYYKLNQQGEMQQSSSDCPQLETLEGILALLKRLLNQDDKANIVQADKRIQILQFLNDYLETSGTRDAEVDNQYKLKELIARTDKAVLVQNDASQSGIQNPNKKDHIEANVVFKYDIPAINSVGCKEALAALIQTIKNAHLQMINYCNESGKCKFNPNPLGSQSSDKLNNLQTTFTLDNVPPTQTKTTSSNSNLSNLNEIASSINDLIKLNNQGFDQKSTNDYLPPIIYHQENLNNNQNVADGLITGSVQTQNNREKNVGAFNNINFSSKSHESSHLSKKHSEKANVLDILGLLNPTATKSHESSHSSKKHSEKANVLDILGLLNPMVTQGPITPSNQYPWNIQDAKDSLYNLITEVQNHRDQSALNGNSNYLIQPTNVIPNSALNTDIIQTKDRQLENIDVINKKYSNILDKNELQRIIKPPTIGNTGIKNPTAGYNGYNLIPLLHTPNVESLLPNYNNDPNQQLYKLAQVLNDKSSSVLLNQKNHKSREQIEYGGGSILSQGFKNLINPSHIPRNQNLNVRQVGPVAYSGGNANLIHHLNSLNLHKLNNLNYNSNKADSSIQNNIGLNFYAPTNFVDYPKHDIGNILIDSSRVPSAANLVKLNSVSDNDGIVELTYKLHRPQPVSYTPYYYVKFRMPYRDFVSKINDLFRNPYMRSNPLKIHKELLAMSYLSEASPDLKNIQREEVSQLILKNGGILINAQVLSANDSTGNNYLKTIQNLNAKLNTNVNLHLFENDKTRTTWPSHVEVPIFKPSGGELRNVNTQSHPRRFFAALPHYESKPVSLPLWPSKVAPKFILNPQPVILLGKL